MGRYSTKVTIDSGEEIHIKKHNNSYKTHIPFIMLRHLGYSSMKKEKITESALSVALQLKARARWLLIVLEANLDTSTLITKYKPLTRSDRNKVSQGYKSLRKERILVRIKPYTYMFNPEFIIPGKNREELAEKYMKYVKKANKE